MTITQDYIKSIFAYREDGVLIRKKQTSNRVKVGDVVGSLNTNGYLRVRVCSKLLYVHQIVFMWHKGYIPKEIDHINGNSLDNRIENIREATHSQNGKNLGLRDSNKIGANNIYFEKSRCMWVARIVLNGKTIHLGRFKNLEDAVQKRKAAEINYYKEFARTNNA